MEGKSGSRRRCKEKLMTAVGRKERREVIALERCGNTGKTGASTKFFYKTVEINHFTGLNSQIQYFLYLQLNVMTVNYVIIFILASILLEVQTRGD